MTSARGGGEAGSGRLVTLLFVAVIAAWILVSQLVFQVLVSGRRNPSAFTAVSGWTFLGLSGVLVAALAVREVTSRREQKRLLSALSSITDPSLARLESEMFFHELLGRAQEVLTADAAVLLTASDGGRRLIVRAVRGFETMGLQQFVVRRGEGLVGQVAQSKEPITVSPTTGAEIAAALARHPIRSFAGVPVRLEDQLLGVVFVTRRNPTPFTEGDIRLLERVGNRLAGTVELDRLDETQRQAMAEGEARMRSLVEAVPVAIIETDQHARVQSWNQAAGDLFGWRRTLAETPHVAFPDDVVRTIRPLVQDATRGKRITGADVRIKRPGGRTVTATASVSQLQGGGVLVLLSDVTDRRQLEQHLRQAQRLEAVARLAGGVAHDFNNLLTVIVGYSEFLLRRLEDDNPIREDIESINSAGQRAAELTKQLLTIGRRSVVEPVVLDLHEHVRSFEAIVRRLVGDNVEVRVVTGTEPGRVRVDPAELEQVVMNLAINARDAMPEHGRLVVETRNVTLLDDAAEAITVRPGPFVVLTVADNGVGMSDQVRERCFDPFFTTKGRGKGTGLGLAAVYGVVTQAGGQIEVVSESGHGTTFRCYFPVVEAASGDEQKAPARKRRSRVKPGSILLVEDEASVRSLARAVLEAEGHEVVDAPSGDQAWVIAEREEFEVLVSDVVMPGMQGDELAARLLKKWPKLHVLLVSAYAEQAAPVAGDRMRYLPKPYTLDELAGAVSDLLRRSRAKAKAKARSDSPPPEPSAPSAGSKGRTRSAGGRASRAR